MFVCIENGEEFEFLFGVKSIIFVLNCGSLRIMYEIAFKFIMCVCVYFSRKNWAFWVEKSIDFDDNPYHLNKNNHFRQNNST